MRLRQKITKRASILISGAALVVLVSSVPAGAQRWRLDRQEGTCQQLNSNIAQVGVTDEEGHPHPTLWGITTYTILGNGLLPAELFEMDLGGTVTPSPAGCLQKSDVPITFQSQTQMTRIDWKPNPPTCGDANNAWAERVRFLTSHEPKHVKIVVAAVKAASAAWANTAPFKACKGILKEEVANLIVVQLSKTFRDLKDRIENEFNALDASENAGSIDCTCKTSNWNLDFEVTISGKGEKKRKDDSSIL